MKLKTWELAVICVVAVLVLGGVIAGIVVALKRRKPAPATKA
jgi:uncharacterized membrane protein